MLPPRCHGRLSDPNHTKVAHRKGGFGYPGSAMAEIRAIDDPETTKADEIGAALERSILFGELPPGTMLRQEQLAEQYGVSRTPIREALRRLDALGLVVFRPNRGVLVRAPSRDELRQTIVARAALEGAAAGRRNPPGRDLRLAPGQRHLPRQRAGGGRDAAPADHGPQRPPRAADAAAAPVRGRPAPPRREPAPASRPARGASRRQPAGGPRADGRSHPDDRQADRWDPRPDVGERSPARGGAGGHVRYVVVGGGAIGGTVAAGLVRDGHDVLVCDADAEHVAAINRDGLTIEGPV